MKERFPDSLDHMTQLVKQLLIIISRPARLLECLVSWVGMGVGVGVMGGGGCCTQCSYDYPKSTYFVKVGSTTIDKCFLDVL